MKRHKDWREGGMDDVYLPECVRHEQRKALLRVIKGNVRPIDATPPQGNLRLVNPGSR